jgi:Zn-dependent M28 family amino/carboxypeptidase
MVGRNSPDSIAVVGMQHSNLGAILQRVSATSQRTRIRVVSDPWPNQGFFFRSDHFNFAKAGVPSIYLLDGVHADYHKPSDELAKLDTRKAAEVAILVFELVKELANAPERPQWNPESYKAIVRR